MHAGPQFEVVQWGLPPECVDSGEEARLMDNRVLERAAEVQGLRGGGRGRIVGGLPGFDPCAEVEIGERRLQVGEIGRIVGLHRIAGGHIVPMVRRDAGLDVEESLGLRVGVIRVGSEMRVPQLLGDHIDVRLADRRVMVLAVVGLIRQSQTVLLDMDDIGLGRSRIAVDGDAEQVGASGRVHRAKRAGERRLVLGLVDGVELAFDGGKSGLVDGVDVEEAFVQRTRFGRRAIFLFKDVTDLVLRVLGELVEGSVAGTVVGKTVHVDPRAVDEAEQILRRAGHGGERCRIDA